MLGEKKALLCPWGIDLDKWQSTKYDYLFGHFEFNGASLNGSTFDGSSYGMQELAKMSPYVFSGHFHIRKEYNFEDGKIITIGCPFQLDWGDYRNSKGYYILQPKTAKYIFQKNTQSPTYIKYFWSKLNKGEQKIEKKKIENNYIKLVIDEGYDYGSVVDTMSTINNYAPIKVEPDYVFSINNQLLGDIKNDNTQMKMTKLQYIIKFIEKLDVQDGVNKKDIIKLAKQYYSTCEGETALFGGQRINFENISMENFKSIGPKLEFDYQKHSGLNYVFGINLDKPGMKNGSGKSTLMTDAILFALFGKTLKNTKNDYIPNRSVPKVKGHKILTDVTINFNVAGKNYRVRSYINKNFVNVISCQLWEGDEEITKSSARETRKYIANDILKCDYELFKKSIVLSASDTYNFFSLKKAQKREYLEGIFRLIIFGDMLKLIRVDKNNLDREIVALQSEVKHAKTTYNDLMEKEVNFDKNKQYIISDLTDKIIKKNVEMDGLKTQLTQSELDQLQSTENISNLRDTLDEMTEGIIKIDNIIKNCSRDIKTATTNINKHTEVYDIICESCKGVFKDTFNIDELEESVNKNKNMTDEYANILETLKGEKKSMTAKINDLIKLKNALTKEAQLVEHNKWVKDHLRDDIIKLADRIDEEKSKDSPFNDLLKKQNELIEQGEKTLATYYVNKTNLDILDLTMGENGAKQYILTDLVGVLNTLVRKYLEETGADFTIIFDNNFNTTFLTTTGESDYSGFSAGECARLNWATTLSFRDILGSNIESNIQVIDELLDGAIDDYATKALIQILRRQIKDKQQTVYLISHKEIIANENFDNIIEIAKAQNFTKIISDPQSGIFSE
jgi:DNA repair exonuclease SbcCD ATPase subunit